MQTRTLSGDAIISADIKIDWHMPQCVGHFRAQTMILKEKLQSQMSVGYRLWLLSLRTYPENFRTLPIIPFALQGSCFFFK